MSQHVPLPPTAFGFTESASAMEPSAAAAAGYPRPRFSTRLREATKTIHRDAERSGFVADLIRGRATRLGYATYLRNLVPLYTRLEERLDALERPSPLMAAFADPVLRRLPALSADIATIAGSNFLRDCAPLSEAEVYAAAIHVADEPRLAAHAYARYLGDLSGGQILRPLLSRSLGLAPNELAFYDFPAVPDVEIPKRAMRDALDTVPPDGPVADAIVDEAIAAFRHTIALSTALSETLGAVPAEA